MIPEDNRTKVIKERWRRWYDARSDWDAQAREDIDFYLGNHLLLMKQVCLQSVISQILQ